MTHKIVIPKMGMSTVEVDLTHWFVEVGTKIQAGDPIAEVESEKANFTIEAEVAGTVVEILVERNETVDVGTTICLVETD